MHDIIFYRDKNGREPVLEYLQKTQKTPIREIKKAKREFADFKERSDIK